MNDLLDANESTWAFVAVDFVGCGDNYQVKRLATLASTGGSRNYCGPTANGRSELDGERAGAGCTRRAVVHGKGAPHPFGMNRLAGV